MKFKYLYLFLLITALNGILLSSDIPWYQRAYGWAKEKIQTLPGANLVGYFFSQPEEEKKLNSFLTQAEEKEKSKNYKQALEIYRKALEAYPNNSKILSHMAKALKMYGLALMKMGDLGRYNAIKVLEEALSIMPWDTEIISTLINLYSQSRGVEFNAMKEELEKRLKQIQEARSKLKDANSLFAKGQKIQAGKLYEELLSLENQVFSPETIKDLLEKLAQIYKHKPEILVAIYKKLLIKNPKNFQLRRNLIQSFFSLIEQRRREGNYETALDLLQNIRDFTDVSRIMENLEYYLMRARILKDMGKNFESLKTYLHILGAMLHENESRKLSTDVWKAFYDQISELFLWLKIGEKNNIIRQIKILQKVYPKNLWLKAYLILLLLKMKEYDSAETELENLFNLDPRRQTDAFNFLINIVRELRFLSFHQRPYVAQMLGLMDVYPTTHMPALSVLDVIK